MSETDKIVMYIVINNDLNMQKGKIASQVGHVVGLITEEIIRKGYETLKPSEQYLTYMKWRKDCTKIVLKAATEELYELIKHPEARYFVDTGNTTQVDPNSLTVVGFAPSDKLGNVVKDFKLL